MSRRSYNQKIMRMARTVAKAEGLSALKIYLDALRCSYVHGASPENYFVLRFFRIPESERKNFLTSGRSKRIDAILNSSATAQDKTTLAKKELFDKAFQGMNRRSFLYAPEATEAEFAEFLSLPQIMLKPRDSTQGIGITRVDTGSIADIPAFYQHCRENSLLLEQIIRQHEELNRINPTCVNSVRINAARAKDGGIHFIGAALRCGGVDAAVDNFHSGGVAYTLDINSGQVLGFGRDNHSLEEYSRHPGSGYYMPGFKVPGWENILSCVRQAMELVPSMGYVGWDLAVTPDGPELIEGNFSYPGGNIIQLDGVGKYPLILSCIGEGHE